MLNACVLIKAVPTKADLILKKIKAIQSVRRAFFTYGRFDIAVFLEVEDYRSIRAVTEEINSIEGVRSTETLVEA